ncbi:MULTISPECIES: FxDxF family PEP-CTERM protein [unclassified Duganella]|uniref:FxDxF family PEP-CTERM protein n=1 Tax=unclassified Duganella TaxID=2636909 RepID=UPI000E349C17|nr:MULTISPECIES: FxDxF family PEP-CTERM protein [unclassified Duganella]RFP09645.1 PEP-CTERM sorting domain-containing protein [Duganella sp. BJB475]RFP27765.1 PEP-CTERM sorting domain-containing protein [Duganella sp. BJB476]
MKLKSFVAGALLAAASVSAFAGDKVISAIADGKTHSWIASYGDGILSGGTDLVDFTGFTPGYYKISVTVSAQDLTLLGTSNLNGALGTVSGDSEFTFLSDKYTGLSPFHLTLNGTAGTEANYSGTYRITAAVPEPETYGMLLGGLALMGVVARRKAKKAA